MLQEPQYFDCDEDGYSGEDRRSIKKTPKWRHTTTQFQVDVLAIFGMTLFPMDDRDIKKDLIEIERGMAPIASLPNLNKALQEDRLGYPFPKEWVDFVITWTKNKRLSGTNMTIRGMINYIRNKEKMIKWLEQKKLYVFTQEKRYATRPEILNRDPNAVADQRLLEVIKDASLEAKYANFPD